MWSSLLSLSVLLVLSSAADLDWWKTANFYQIYPRSFKDANDDGIGDIHGIIEKLVHFSDAGVDAIWLSPIFKSPQVDQGYDISNYTDIEPDYGTMTDVIGLIKESQARGVKVILDFVPNHTSDQHQWFIDSVNRIEPYTDFYIWHDGVVDENGERRPPNNWISIFKNSSWSWNDDRQQYFLHQFSAYQPDLNYWNPEVVKAMQDVLLFWLDQGVDGFRIDAVNFLIEDPDLLDEPLSNNPGYNDTDYEYLDHIYTKDLPGTYDIVYQWRELMDNYTLQNNLDQKVIMTEAYTDPEKTLLYYGTPDGTRLGAHFTFNFVFITDINANSSAVDIARLINRWIDNIPGIYTSNWVLGNHDNHRVATRFGPANVDGFNMLKSVLPGVAVTYNGEEIGQENGEVTYEEGQDPSARDPEIFEQVSRDFERTPYQWDDSVNAGFNRGAKPWLPVSEKYNETNLQKQKETSQNSHFKIYQSLARLRRTSNPVKSGDLVVDTINDDVIVVKRSTGDESLVLVFNIGDRRFTADFSAIMASENNVDIVSVDSTKRVGSSVDPAELNVDPHEAFIITF